MSGVLRRNNFIDVRDADFQRGALWLFTWSREPVSKEMMLGIAKDYERLAERAAERAKGERP